MCRLLKRASASELVTLQRRKGTEAVFEAMQELVTYRVNAVRRQTALRRLMGLGRGLTHDRIDDKAQEQVTDQLIVSWMIEQVRRLREAADFETLAKQITGVDLITIGVRGTIIEEGEEIYVQLTLLQQTSSAIFRPGRSPAWATDCIMAYWKAQATRDAIEWVKVEVIVLAQDHDGMQRA